MTFNSDGTVYVDKMGCNSNAAVLSPVYAIIVCKANINRCALQGCRVCMILRAKIYCILSFCYSLAGTIMQWGCYVYTSL